MWYTHTHIFALAHMHVNTLGSSLVIAYQYICKHNFNTKVCQSQIFIKITTTDIYLSVYYYIQNYFHLPDSSGQLYAGYNR